MPLSFYPPGGRGNNFSFSHVNKTNFHKKGCTLGLILKVRVFGTQIKVAFWFGKPCFLYPLYLIYDMSYFKSFY